MSSGKLASDFDPVFVNSRREALIILCSWVACLIWAVPYCYLNGYPDESFDPAQLETTWGMPSWVFWGIVVPWILATAFTLGFCLFVMRDDDLGAAAGPNTDTPSPAAGETNVATVKPEEPGS
ncbi:MAG: hypothetical protein CMJ81_10025 [Planctomycetaceae bacterium]|nr:hypothetical protein [Planctomycetaceae bacterium]